MGQGTAHERKNFPCSMISTPIARRRCRGIGVPHVSSFEGGGGCPLTRAWGGPLTWGRGCYDTYLPGLRPWSYKPNKSGRLGTPQKKHSCCLALSPPPPTVVVGNTPAVPGTF